MSDGMDPRHAPGSGKMTEKEYHETIPPDWVPPELIQMWDSCNPEQREAMREELNLMWDERYARVKQHDQQEWCNMSTEQKIRHIMWRFMMHPKYTDKDHDHWRMTLEWDMAMWDLEIRRSDTIEYSWTCDLDSQIPDMLEHARDQIFGEIHKEEEPEGWRDLLENHLAWICNNRSDIATNTSNIVELMKQVKDLDIKRGMEIGEGYNKLAGRIDKLEVDLESRYKVIEGQLNYLQKKKYLQMDEEKEPLTGSGHR